MIFTEKTLDDNDVGTDALCLSLKSKSLNHTCTLSSIMDVHNVVLSYRLAGREVEVVDQQNISIYLQTDLMGASQSFSSAAQAKSIEAERLDRSKFFHLILLQGSTLPWFAKLASCHLVADC